MEDLKGSWALITGAGRGIGRQLAFDLSTNGISIIGVSRTASDLESLRREIEQNNVRFVPVVLDLSAPQAAETLYQKLEELDMQRNLKILCLNAAANAAGSFEEIPLEAQERLIYLNALFPLKFIRKTLPVLRKNAPSFVITLSSQGAMIPTPWMATYSASKSFVHNLSLALHHEFKNDNINFLTVVPSHTDSSALDRMQIPKNLQDQMGRGRNPTHISRKIIQGLSSPCPVLITNVNFFYLFRLFLGVAPISFIVESAGKLFKSLRKGSFYTR